MLLDCHAVGSFHETEGTLDVFCTFFFCCDVCRTVLSTGSGSWVTKCKGICDLLLKYSLLN